jgi:vacuolar-type H+-ATPase subunit H
MFKGAMADRSNTADAAINRVLEAERTAQNEIAACRRDALAILSEARARSRALAERADRRITLLHKRSDNSLKRELTRLRRQARELSAPPKLTPELSASLDKALDLLLRELTGVDP